ncbi:MAG: nicotinate phosphoribosyltransferase, partial [Thermonemataceae bacterium]|nr:nicotinate phosphoribosyltransferase [Thermonemataceae bacterium]
DPLMLDPMDATRRKKLNDMTDSEDLLVPIFEKGKLVYQLPAIEEIRNLVQAQLKGFHQGIKRFVNPHSYPVGLEKGLSDDKYDLIMRLRVQK